MRYKITTKSYEERVVDAENWDWGLTDRLVRFMKDDNIVAIFSADIVLSVEMEEK